jgi:hypothetical protein
MYDVQYYDKWDEIVTVTLNQKDHKYKYGKSFQPKLTDFLKSMWQLCLQQIPLRKIISLFYF